MKLNNGSNWVEFTNNAGTWSMVNSLGQKLEGLTADNVDERIARLTGAGWR
jgi:hypothetical protein